MAFVPREDMTYEVFAPLTRWGRLRNSSKSSLSLSLLYRVSFTPEPPLQLGLLPAFHHKSTSLAVSTPSTFSRFQAATSPWRQPTSSCCPRSVSHALRPLLRPGPPGLVSCRSRPWGFCPPGFNPPAEPHVLSNAVALLWLAQLPVSASTPLPFQVIQTMTLHTHNNIFDAAPLETGPTSRPCSPRASAPASGGLDRYTSRNPHGLSPP
jgi:hypothetical protein